MSAGGDVVCHETVPSCDSEVTRMPSLWRGFLRSRVDLARARGTQPSLNARAADVFASRLVYPSPLGGF